MSGRDNDYKENPDSNVGKNNEETAKEEQGTPVIESDELPGIEVLAETDKSFLAGVQAEVSIDEERAGMSPDGFRGEYAFDSGISGEDSGMSGP